MTRQTQRTLFDTEPEPHQLLSLDQYDKIPVAYSEGKGRARYGRGPPDRSSGAVAESSKS